MIQQPNVDEIISFLEDFGAEKIRSIRDKNPSFSSVLKRGVLCGESDTGQASQTASELKVRAEVAQKGLESLITISEKKKILLLHKIEKAKKLTLTSKILTATCSSAILATIAKEYYSMSIVLGVVNIIILVINIFSENILTSVNGDKKISELLIDVITCQSNAEVLFQELNFFVLNSFNMEGTANNINQSNKLLYKFNTDIKPFILTLNQ